MSFIQRYTVRLVKDGRVNTEVKAITQPQDVFCIMAPMLENLCVEQFHVIMVDTKHKVIGISLVSQGTLSSAIIAPRDIFQRAILANSARIILVHNHPSGDPAPSNEDKIVTKKLAEAGSLMGIDVLDHVIIGEGTYESLKTLGVI